jgi:molybdate transport system permease protein
MQPLKYASTKHSWFRNLTVGIAFFFTFLLFIAVGALLFVLKPSEICSALFSEEMFYSMKLSMLTSSASTLSVMCFSIPTAYALSRFSFQGKSLIKTVLGLPMAFPELVMGLALLLLFGQGFLGPYLEAAGIKVTFSKLGIVVAQFFVAFPYAIRVIYSTFEDINPRYEQVSRSFGYGEFETFRHVTLPMARSGLFASSVITFARCIGAFGAVLVLAGGSYMHTEVLPVTLYLNISYGNLEMAVTSGILLMGIAFLAILSFERFEGGKL